MNTTLRESTASWNEADVELAERYLAALTTIRDQFGVMDWTEEDVEQAEGYTYKR